jgi:hypothetical protein
VAPPRPLDDRAHDDDSNHDNDSNDSEHIDHERLGELT